MLKILQNTLQGKSFKGENFRSWLGNRESFPTIIFRNRVRAHGVAEVFKT